MPIVSPAAAQLTGLTTALADRYRLEQEIGAGGMATVYRARDLRHDRDVALKVLRADVGEALGRERFLREIRLAASLTHPHILPLHDSGAAGDTLWFTMPLLAGRTLRDRLVEGGPLPVDEAVRLAGEVADALDYAHRHDVVHRDIKPENILLHEGHAVVADFGIGKALVAAAEHGTTYTQVGLTVGTPAYMSPEQAAGEAVDGRSDLFALGCVLFELLTGQVAFEGKTVQATIARRFVHVPPPVHTLRPEVPEALARLVDALLAKEAEARLQSGAAVVHSLRTTTSVAVAAPAAAAPVHTERSLVVLPFANVSPDADAEYFSDGLTDELIVDLARVKALRIISRTTAMQYKGTTLSLRAIGEALGVAWALTGSVRRAGNALRISAQLVDVRSDEPRWAEKYSGTLDDVFDVQERVSRAIVAALDVVLSEKENAALARHPVSNVRAFELYLRAREALWGYDPARAEPLIARAIEIEGPVPALRAVRAMSRLMLLRVGATQDRAILDEVEREAHALVALAPQEAYGHALLGYACYEAGDHVRGVPALRRAMELDPSDPEIRFFHGISLHAVGTRDRMAQEWLANDPLSPLANLLVGVVQWFTGNAVDGTPAMEESVRLAPESFILQWGLAYHYVLVGRLADGARGAAWLAERAPHFPYAVQVNALCAALAGRRDEARAMLATVDLDALDGHHTFHIAEAFVMAGETERGIALLATAVEKGFYPIDYYERLCPFLAPVRGTPAFDAVLARARERVAVFAAAVG